ncbi:MAG: tyrosine--tRNA ligase [Clostridia bacterium]|nr:tyrosine--tRNA ligase [Clostridia bacterium]
MTDIIKELEDRGYIEQLTHEDEIRKLFQKESVRFYIGIDPTANSMHIGHFVALMVASRLQKAGHRPIILMGGGTATIGDPSGRTDMRQMLTREQLDANVAAIKKQAERFVSFEGENAAIIVNNADWLLDLKYIDFMREIGSQFTVSKMLAQECYKNRLETGLTFFEMGYLLLQSYDFWYLHKKYDCKLQIGGNDQWSNIIGGVELIRRIGSNESFGLTFKLLTTADGKKMGKTAKGALWLNPERTSPYEFYQYWRNIGDTEVEKVLSLLTYLPDEEVKRLSSLKDEKINDAKKIAAYEITKLIHGEEEAKKAEEASEALFGGNKNTDNMPTTELSNREISIIDAMIEAKLVSSKGQAKDLINQGGVSLNDEKISDIKYVLSEKDFKEGYAIIQKGKKVFHKIV